MVSRALVKAYAVAGLALIAAIAVYCFARSQPPVLLPQIDLLHGLVPVDGILFASAPSFFYTLAFGLLLGLVSPSANVASINCLLWTGIALGLELSQLSIPSQALVAWLQDPLPAPAWNLIGPYWINGVFDPTDLLATLLGGLLAWLMLRRYSGGNKNDSYS